MMFLRRLMLRRKLRNGAKVDSIYTVISMYNEFGQKLLILKNSQVNKICLAF